MFLSCGYGVNQLPNVFILTSLLLTTIVCNVYITKVVFFGSFIVFCIVFVAQLMGCAFTEWLSYYPCQLILFLLDCLRTNSFFNLQFPLPQCALGGIRSFFPGYYIGSITGHNRSASHEPYSWYFGAFRPIIPLERHVWTTRTSFGAQDRWYDDLACSRRCSSRRNNAAFYRCIGIRISSKVS